MTENPENTRFERVLQRFDPHSQLMRVWALTGGVSAQVTALEYKSADGQVRKAVVRQHGAIDLAQNPHVAADEFRLLQILKAAGLAAPAPYDVDESATVLSSPYVVVEYIDGVSEFSPIDLSDFMTQLAVHLAGIHRVDTTTFDLSFLPQKVDSHTERLMTPPLQMDVSLYEDRIRDTLNAAWPLTQKNPSGLLHGDFWPGNILWRAGQLVGIIDWEDAALGDPLMDLANARLEILWAFGWEAMLQFTQAYTGLMSDLDLSQLPYWDLCMALRPIGKMETWTDDASMLQRMREGLIRFATDAFQRLG